MTDKFQVNSFSQDVSITQGNISDALGQMSNTFKGICDLVATNAVDSLTVTAVAKVGSTEIKVTEMVYDSKDDHRSVVVDTGWTHKLEGSAADTYSVLSEAVALTVEDDDVNVTIDIGSTAIGILSRTAQTSIDVGDDDDE